MKTITIVGVIAGILALATAATATLSNMAYAKDTANGNDPNLFGKGASDLGKGGDMGEHSSDPLPNEPGRETPRHGIGNVGPDLGITCGSKHPADLADALTNGACEEP